MCLHLRRRRRCTDSRRAFGHRWRMMFKKQRTDEAIDLDQEYDIRFLFQIELEKNVERSGRPVTGTVKCHSPLFAIEVGRMTLTLQGFANYSYYKGLKKIKCHEQFLDIRKPLLEDGKLEIGLTNISFEFNLIPNLPPSYKKLGTSFNVDIRYRLKLRLENYNINGDPIENSFTMIKDFQLRESRSLHLTHVPVNPNLRLSMCPKGDGLTIEVGINLEKRWFVPGHRIRMNLHVVNNTSINIKAVHVNLLRYLTIRRTEDTPPDVVKVCLDASFTSFEIKHHAESYILVELRTRPKLVSINQTVLFSIDFKLQVVVNMPGPYQKGILEIPIQMTERRVKAVPHCANHNERYLDDLAYY